MKTTLVYAGTEYQLAHRMDLAEVLTTSRKASDTSGETPLIPIELVNGSNVFLDVTPGIPIALIEHAATKPPGRSR